MEGGEILGPERVHGAVAERAVHWEDADGKWCVGGYMEAKVPDGEVVQI